MLKFLKSRNRKSRNRSRRNRSRAAARLEHLENRQLLAADVMAPEEYRLNAEELASDSVIVQFRADTPMSVSAMDSVVALAGEMGHSLGRDGLYEVMVDPGMTPREAIAILNENPMVQYASPNFLVSAAATPNDPLFGDQWGLNNTGQTGGVVDADIDATEGWDIATDAGSVVVAIIDSGVDYNHPDLVNNIWTNAGEIDGDGIDNDGNGFVDDVYGWDFFSNDNDPMDENFHGTHVAGIVGAEGNNGIGVAGTAWDVQLMSLRFLGPNGTGSLAGALRAINYANDMGADIANNSWGGGGFSQALQDAITDFTDRGGIFTAAAGNHGRNNDEQNYFPANYDGVIAVANSTDDDVRRRDSGFGVNSVEIAAPGDNILSTFPTNNGSYNSIGGTSMATPMVSGALAILMEQFPNELPEQLVERMMMSTDDVMRDVTTYGRLNLRNALEFQRDNPLPIANDDDAVTDEDVSVVVDVLANDFDPEGQAIFVTDVRTGQGAVAVVNDDGTVTFTPAPDANGETIFRYTISDGNGGLASANVTVTVNAVNDAPRPSDFSDNVNTGRTLTISDAVLLNQAFDVEGDAMSIDGFGDAANGTVEVLDGAVRYTPNQGFVGNDSFEFRITDGQNAGAAMVLVTVNNADTPEALNDTFTVLEDVQTDLDVLANDTDPNGDRLRIVDVSNPDRGRTFIRGSRSVVYTSDRDLNGPDSFTYTVRDTAGNEDTATVNVNVLPVNDAPIANLNFARISEGSRVGRQLVLLNDNDPDGDDFTITSVTQGQNGRVILHENDTISYIPEQDFFGEDEYTYTITDVHGLSDTASVFITVRPVQDPPRASDDRAEANGTTPVVIDVLANDVDVDGDDLVVTFVSNPDNGTAVLNADGTVTYTADAQFRGLDSFNYRISDGNGGISSATVLVTVTQDTNDDPNAVDDTVRTDFEQALTIPVADLLENDSDPNSDDLSVIAVGDAANGNVVLSGDEVRYTPNAGFEGTDTFTYTISDGQGGTATATVSVVVAPQNNSAPVAVNDLLTTEFEQPIVITHAEMLANDFDPDQDIIRVVGAGSARNGTLTSSRGAFTFTPDAGFSGQTQFAYRISDGELTDLGFVLINVNEPANNDPVANDDSATVNEDESIVIDVLANDSDVDGDNLSIGSVTDPTNGTARINADGTVTYTPDTNYSGSDSFRYSLQDGNGGNATGTVNVTITPVNDAPTAVDDFFNSDFGERLDIDFADVLANDTDIDGDDLSITSVGNPANGTASIVNGQIRYTPNAVFSGTDSFTYEVSDGELTDTATIRVTVDDAPPTDDHGNDIASATLITLDANGAGSDTGVLEQLGDNDYFRIDLTSAGTTEINLLRGDGSNVDTFLHLLDADGNEITFNDDGGAGRNSRLVRDLDAGTYYIRARAWANRSTGDYSVTVQHDATTSNDDHADTPGDDATLLTFDGDTATATAVLEQSGDRDVFRMEVPTDSEVTIDLTGQINGVDTFLRLYDANGTQIAFNDDGGPGVDSRLVQTLPAGTYFVSVGSYRDRFDGSVQLNVTRTALDDHGNDIGNATDLTVTGNRASATGTFEQSGDRDVFSFTLNERRTVTIDLSADNGSGVDTFLRLYRSNGGLITSDDDGGTGFNSRITITLDAGTYFIGAGSYRDLGTGDFRLDLLFS